MIGNESIPMFLVGALEQLTVNATNQFDSISRIFPFHWVEQAIHLHPVNVGIENIAKGCPFLQWHGAAFKNCC
jgi:hypothetical protein